MVGTNTLKDSAKSCQFWMLTLSEDRNFQMERCKNEGTRLGALQNVQSPSLFTVINSNGSQSVGLIKLSLSVLPSGPVFYI